MTAEARRGSLQARPARVVARIHDHLDLDRLADLAHYSAFHWHRIWHAVFGETIAATVRRLRMHRAAGMLAHTPDQSIARIARQCGYPNVESFSRSFRASHGMTPTAFRRHGTHRHFDEATGAAIIAVARPEGAVEVVAGAVAGRGAMSAGDPSAVAAAAAALRVDIREVPTIHLAGCRHQGSTMAIGKAFETAFVAMHAAGLVDGGSGWLAAYFDDPFATDESMLRAQAGLTLPDGAEVPAGLTGFTLGGGCCAVLRHRGPYADMRSAYRWLYGRWLPASGLEPADRPVFEAYLNHPRDTAPADLLTEIFLPLNG